MDLRGKRCVELGAGTGLVGISAAALGAHVMVTDQMEHVQMMQQNVEFNCQTTKASRGFVKAQELNWGAAEPLPKLFGRFAVNLILVRTLTIFGI